MRDLEDQLRAYAEVLDQSAAELEGLAGPRRSRFASWRIPPALVVASAAAVVLLVVGGLTWLGGRSGSTPIATTLVEQVDLPEVTSELLNPSAVRQATFPDIGHFSAGPGAVVRNDGFHMLSAAYGNRKGAVTYLTSADGVVWAPATEGAVLLLGEAPWAPLEFERAIPRSVVIDESGRWQLFFDIAWQDPLLEKMRVSIGRAVAPGPTGPWTFDDTPVIAPDAEIEWRSAAVTAPSVVSFDDELTMFFIAFGGPGGAVVGVARSGDGSVWEIDSEPGLPAIGEWTRGEIVRVDAIALEGGVAVFFAGDTTSRRGLAMSADLETWIADPRNPIVTTLDAPRASIYDTEFIQADGSVLAYLETGGPRTSKEVAVVRLDLDLTATLEALLAD